MAHRRAPSPADPHPPPLAAHAVVVGASFAGLAAAQALSHHVERVTIVERDDLPERPSARPGVPQGRHLHVLQPGGSAALERLLPGFQAELLAAGATELRVPEDVLWMTPAGWAPRVGGRRADHVLLAASRELTEWAVRRRVYESPQILVRAGLEVRGLVVRDGRVQGVDVRSWHAEQDAPTVTIDADIVVDASGRGSDAADWLDAAGLEPPAETVIDSDLVYASRMYRRTPGDTPGWKGALIQANPPHEPRGAILFPIEGNRWLLTMSAAGGDEPPKDEAGFTAFARSLRAPDVADVIERAEPLGTIATYRRTENRWRHYERMERPDGFLAVGDALRAFNPLYGQGISTAALAAEALDRGLGTQLERGRDLAGFSAHAQPELVKASAGAWLIATGVDLRYPTVKGDTRGRVERARDALVVRYMDRVTRAATHDPVVNAALFDAVSLLAEPWSLMRPGIAWRALRPGPRTPSPRPVWPAGSAPAAGPAPVADGRAAE